MTPAQQANFNRLIAPRHVAVIGGDDAAVVINECRRIGYAGELWPVNPRRSEIAGIRCVATCADLPQAPDAVFLAVPAAPALNIIRQLSQMDAGGVVCYTAGFSADGSHGPQADRDVIEAAGSMALVGPNCYGLINYIDKVALWPFAHGGYCPGYGAAVITQSGMLSSDITMNQRSLPLAFMVSAGNQSVLRLEDYVDTLCERPEVRAIGLHIEGLHNIPAFCNAAVRARELGKPIVALKTGTSKIGATLTVSHTGSLSGDNELYQALFRHLGIISVDSPAQFVETLKYLVVCKPVKGKRLIGFTCSGGGATLLADHAESLDLQFDEISGGAGDKLARQLPAIASVTNPLDYTTPIWGNAEKTLPVFSTAVQDGYDAAILVQDYPLPGLDESRVWYRNDAQAFIEAAALAGIPAAVCSTLAENIDRETREWMIDKGAAPLQGIHEALNAIDAASWYEYHRTEVGRQAGPMRKVDPLRNIRQYDEARAKALLAAAGLDIPPGQVCSADAVRQVAHTIGFPVVLKANSGAIAHKTEAGAVAVGLRDSAAVGDALSAMQASVAAGGFQCESFLIEAMMPAPLAELLVSVRRDAEFGWAMTLATGGVFVDMLQDAVTLLLPTDNSQLLRALDELAVAKLLHGYRGKPAVERQMLVAQIQRIAQFAMASDPAVAEIEINPLFIYRERVCVVDVLLRCGEPGT